MSKSKSRVSKVLVTGPLASFAGSYREELVRRRYTPLSAVGLERQVARMSRWWLAAEGLGVKQLNEARVEAFLSVQRARGLRPGLSRDCNYNGVTL